MSTSKATIEALTAGGAVLAACARSRRTRIVAGAALLTGSALTRFGIFSAGVQSAKDPKYTVGPQRQRLQERSAAGQPGSASPAGPVSPVRSARRAVEATEG